MSASLVPINVRTCRVPTVASRRFTLHPSYRRKQLAAMTRKQYELVHRITEEWSSPRAAKTGLGALMKPVHTTTGHVISQKIINDMLDLWAAPLMLLRERCRHIKFGRVGVTVQGVLRCLQSECLAAHKQVATEEGTALTAEQQTNLDLRVAKLLVRSFSSKRQTWTSP